MNFVTTPEEFNLMHLIAKRAVNMARGAKIGIDKADILMDINACHCNGCPLNLEELVIAPDSDFLHDVFGIHNHINRTTGELEDCFLPRYAKREVKAR